MAPFVTEKHLFPNLGDGTYITPARLRSAPRSRWAHITYKLLYNDAVAMTGGQRARERLRRAADHPPAGGRGRGRAVIVADDVAKLPQA